MPLKIKSVSDYKLQRAGRAPLTLINGDDGKFSLLVTRGDAAFAQARFAAMEKKEKAHDEVFAAFQRGNDVR